MTQSPNNRLFDEPFLHKLEQLAILSRRAMAGQMQGERRSPRRGQSVEFADFRPYVMGDDLRRIDWNAYARLERFFIKLFVNEEDLTVHLLIDASRSMDWGEPNKLRYAARAAGALGYIALSSLDRVTATTIGPSNGLALTFAPRRGKQQALALFAFLQALAEASTAGLQGSRLPDPAHLASTTLGPRLRAYAAQATQPGPLLLFSDLLDDGWADGLRALAACGFEVTLLHILSPDELDPALEGGLAGGEQGPLQGDLKLLDIESGADVEITADYDLLQRYRDGLESWRQELRQFCSARGMHYVPVVTSLPFETLLFAVLRQRGVVR
ncbi:MAG: DUF58 domain-containing protein [Anaerolineae bacterium]|nr:DUF58 domain-containing protein [Anaerolineae bacterium]